jgi:uncharacterized protein (TIGR02266 family)
MGSERRRSHRGELIVRVDYSTIDELFQEFTGDINEGGMFIETDSARTPGTEVLLRFSLPGSDKIVETVGTVVRVSDGSDGDPPGMGIEFEDLREDDRAHIDRLVRGLRSGRGVRGPIN